MDNNNNIIKIINISLKIAKIMSFRLENVAKVTVLYSPSTRVPVDHKKPMSSAL